MDTQRIADKVVERVIEGESLEMKSRGREAKVSPNSLKRSQGTLIDVAQRMFDKYTLTAGELDRAMAMTLDSRLFENAFEKVMKSWNVEIRD